MIKVQLREGISCVSEVRYASRSKSLSFVKRVNHSSVRWKKKTQNVSATMKSGYPSMALAILMIVIKSLNVAYILGIREVREKKGMGETRGRVLDILPMRTIYIYIRLHMDLSKRYKFMNGFSQTFSLFFFPIVIFQLFFFVTIEYMNFMNAYHPKTSFTPSSHHQPFTQFFFLFLILFNVFTSKLLSRALSTGCAMLCCVWRAIDKWIIIPKVYCDSSNRFFFVTNNIQMELTILFVILIDAFIHKSTLHAWK